VHPKRCLKQPTTMGVSEMRCIKEGVLVFATLLAAWGFVVVLFSLGV